MAKDLYDLIVVGAGPAGLSAAIYAGRAKLKTLVIEKAEFGGQIKITSEVVNYPGVFKTSGSELASEMQKQAASFGVEFISDEVVDVDFSGDIKEVKTKVNETYRAVGVLIATGARPRKLGFEGEAEFGGRGVAYCATCDGEMFAGKDIFVIGGGFAAAEEAIFLTRFGRKVTVIVREDEFTCSKTIADKVLSDEKIEVKFCTEVVYVRGEKLVKEVKLINNKTKETWTHYVREGDNTFGVFVFVGYEPLSEVFKGHIGMDEQGYILTRGDMETDVPGVYAAGDIRPKRLRQLVTASSDGAIASTAIERYIEDKKDLLGIKIEQKESEVHTSLDLFSEQDISQISYVMERCTGEIQIIAILDKSDLSEKMKSFLNEFAKITDKVNVTLCQRGENSELEKAIPTDIFPVIALMDTDGKFAGISFNGVPGGHELTSFVLAIYNAAGPGQAISETLESRIKAIESPLNLKVGVSLSCTMCPDIVQAAQRISVLNKNINAAMVDLQYYPDIRDKFDIMSIPVLIINDKDVLFGKKSVDELVGYIEKYTA